MNNKEIMRKARKIFEDTAISPRHFDDDVVVLGWNYIEDIILEALDQKDKEKMAIIEKIKKVKEKWELEARNDIVPLTSPYNYATNALSEILEWQEEQN